MTFKRVNRKCSIWLGSCRARNPAMVGAGGSGVFAGISDRAASLSDLLSAHFRTGKPNISAILCRWKQFLFVSHFLSLSANHRSFLHNTPRGRYSLRLEAESPLYAGPVLWPHNLTNDQMRALLSLQIPVHGLHVDDLGQLLFGSQNDTDD